MENKKSLKPPTRIRPWIPWPFLWVIGSSPCSHGTFQAGPQGLQQRSFQQDFLRHLGDRRTPIVAFPNQPCRMIL